MPSATPARSIPRRPSHTSPLQTCSPIHLQSRSKRPSRTRRRLLAVTSLGLAGLLAGLLSGCATGIIPNPASTSNTYTRATGNWQFSSSAAAVARLPTVGGSLSVTSFDSSTSGATPAAATITGLLLPLSAVNSCLSLSSALSATGSIDASGNLTLSAPIPNSQSASASSANLTITGLLSADRKSLTAATYTISGGPCATPALETLKPQTLRPETLKPQDNSTPVTAQQYQPVSGTYAGTLTTAEGQSFALSSTLTQTSQPDANGVYHVQGTASSPGNTCVPASLPATASTIDGGSISTTYTDSATGTTITGTGSTSPDAATITITSWTINSPCGQDTGTAILTRQ